jgi:hypothetical protein
LSDPSRLSIQLDWYAELWQWATASLKVHHLEPESPPIVNPDQISYDGKPVIYWWLKELGTTHLHCTKEGAFTVAVKFDNPHVFQIGAVHRQVIAIEFFAERSCLRKRKQVEFQGDGIFDWQKNELKIPASGEVRSEGIRTDFSDWEPHSGPIPERAGILCLTWRVYKPPPHPPNVEVVDVLSIEPLTQPACDP